MKKTLLFILIFSTISLWSQLNFEKGYFIDNQSQKHEVLIKNVDWLQNPSSFKYKTDENSEEKTATVNDVKEFQVYGYNRLVKYTGKVNVSSSDLQNLSSSPEPDLKDITTFLYEISAGKKNLYSFFQKGNQNFFYSDETGKINLLIYKKYNPSGNTSLLAYNDKYKSQLNYIFSDDADVLKMVEKTEYSDSSLIKIFNKYNRVSTEQNKQSLEKVKTKIRLSIKPGVNFSNLKIYSLYTPQDYEIKLNSVDPKFSTEMEFVLPFNKNKWSLLLEATYSTMNAKSKTIDTNKDISLKYGYMEFPIGVRYGMNINEKSIVFASVKFPIFTLKTSGGKLPATSDNYFDLQKMSSNFIFGVGYSYKNKLFAEFSTSMRRSVTYYMNWGSSFSYNSISIGYNIF